MANGDAMTSNFTDSKELINRSLIKAWLCTALFWLTIVPIVGLLLSIKFHNPDFMGGRAWWTFGRLRPVHVNGVIFGSFTTTFLGLLYFYVPRLCGVRMYKEVWGWLLLCFWNAFLLIGSISFVMGHNSGIEAGEYEWPLNLLRFAVLALVGIQVVGTIIRRKERRFYVSLWYTVAGLFWTLMNLITGGLILPYAQQIAGVNSAAFHGLYIHDLVGLWLTPAGLAMIYYFLPPSTKNPLYSHRLSLLGFWSLAFFYPIVGIHHYMYSPIPHLNQVIAVIFSMLLIIPVWSVVVNWFGTVSGRWGQVLGGVDSDSYAAKFLLLGAVYYLLGCFQGSTEALMRLQQLTHFTDFVIGHSHLTVFGAMINWGIGGIYYVWPRVTGRKLWSNRLASWHLWLTISGFSIMILGLTAQGFIQGSMLEYGANFVDTVKEMKPWWIARSIAGATMDLGFLLLVIECYKTMRKGEPFQQETSPTLSPEDEAIRSVSKQGLLENPPTIALVAGVGFFMFAVFIQAIVPFRSPETRVTTVEDEVVKKQVQVADYTSLELYGRHVYIREGCWYCHSQYIRPVTGETERWGPVSQTGEYAYDRPHLFSTRRIGPDLTRVGRKYADGWHIAHYWNPRHVVPDSIMPSFPWLFEPVKGNETPQLNEDGKALVAYVQKLGTSIGDWRETFTPTRVSAGAALHVNQQQQGELALLGKAVYERRCIGCHGEKGDGQGPAAVFLENKPRDFTRGIFKFRSTPGKDSLPTDADLFIAVTHGLWGTPMPTWAEISERERLAVIQYIKAFSDRWKREKVRVPITVTSEPPVTRASIQNGEKLYYRNANCFVCHGNGGKGDGPRATALKDVWGRPTLPANFTLPAGVQRGVKLGHDGEHIFRTIMTGVGGTQMPAFQDQLTPAEVWDIVHYEQSLRVKAHESELIERGLRNQDRAAALSEIWKSLSVAASQGRIAQALLDQELAELKLEDRILQAGLPEDAPGRQPAY
jgi:cbb3-type cytochrome c oxidase subunit I/cbb3-type cytochrome c oxidase subunit II